MHNTFRFESLKEKDYFEDLCIGKKIILRVILEKWVGSVDWIHLAQKRDQWQALVNTVTS
jgi:hypothetical protein